MYGSIYIYSICTDDAVAFKLREYIAVYVLGEFEAIVIIVYRRTKWIEEHID